MTTTDTAADPRTRTAGRLLTGLFVLAAGAILVALFWPGPPQMGADPQVFATVDALFTAVTARDEKAVGECERRLNGYRESGRLPADAATALDAVIRQARSGAWASAADRLYAFMLAQRRDGADVHRPAKAPPTTKPKR